MSELVPIPSITALYAGALGLMSLVIGFLAGRYRGPGGVSIGDGGRHEVLVAMRRHANFAEWTPMAVVLIALLEMNRVSPTAIHVLGAALVIVRASHAFGMQPNDANQPFRFVGAAGTFLLTAVASVWAITTFF